MMTEKNHYYHNHTALGHRKSGIVRPPISDVPYTNLIIL